MMREIKRWIADDNTEFTSPEACQQHEAFCAEVAAVLGRLRPRPKPSEDPQKWQIAAFENGDLGYLQQDRATFLSVRADLLRMAQRYTTHSWLQYGIDNSFADGDLLYRVIAECCPQPLSRAWARILCVDSFAREWGQSYFIAHPEKVRNR